MVVIGKRKPHHTTQRQNAMSAASSHNGGKRKTAREQEQHEQPRAVPLELIGIRHAIPAPGLVAAGVRSRLLLDEHRLRARTQAMDTMGKDGDDAPKAVRSADEIARQAAFDARIDAGDFIEPQDWMPEALPQDAGAPDQPARALARSSACCPKATGSRARRRSSARPSCWPRCRTKAATACTSTRAAETLGISRDQMLDALHQRQGQVQLDLQLPDADLGRRRHDRLAGRRRGDHEPGADLPLLLRAVCARDDPHLQGRKLPPAPGLRDPADDDDRARSAARDGAGRGEPLVVAGLTMFGPPDADSPNSAQSMRWGIKRIQQRRPAPEIRRRHRAAGRGSWA